MEKFSCEFVQQEKGLVGDLIAWLAFFLIYLKYNEKVNLLEMSYGLEMIFSTSDAAALLPLVLLEIQKSELELDFL